MVIEKVFSRLGTGVTVVFSGSGMEVVFAGNVTHARAGIGGGVYCGCVACLG